jgi:cytochrome P450
MAISPFCIIGHFPLFSASFARIHPSNQPACQPACHPAIMWRLLLLLLGVAGVLPIVVLVLVVLVRIGLFYVRYQLRKWRFEHVPTIDTLGSIPMLRLFEAGALEGLLQSVFDSDGNVRPVVFGGAHLDGTPWLLFSDVNDIKALLQDTAFPKLPIIYDGIAEVIGDGLVTSSGSVWRQQRRLITPIMHFGNLRKMTPVIVSNVVRWIDEMRQLDGRVVSPFTHFSTLTLRVVIDCVFGRDSLPAERMVELWHEIMVGLTALIMFATIFSYRVTRWLPFAWNLRLRRATAEIQTLIRELIGKRRAEIAATRQQQQQQHAVGEDDTSEPEAPADLLTALLLTRYHSSSGMSDDLVLAECQTFLAAGHDTTSNLLSWAMYFLGRLPNRADIICKLRAEVLQVLADGSIDSSSGLQVLRNAEHQDIPLLRYCRQFLMETLRMRPPAGLLDRVAAQDCTLAGVFIPKGTYVYPFTMAPQFDKRFWTDPLVFRPERFETLSLLDDEHQQHKHSSNSTTSSSSSSSNSSSSSSSSASRHPYAFLPFSAGARNCVAQKFAILEASIVLAYIVHHFDIECDPEAKVLMKFQGTATPDGFLCAFKPRSILL